MTVDGFASLPPTWQLKITEDDNMSDETQIEIMKNQNEKKPAGGSFLYELKQSLISDTEKSFFTAIKHVLPEAYFLQPQINLASIIRRTDNYKFQNELYRNIDACVFDKKYKPILLIEINDDTHKVPDRRERDQKVKAICEEAGIPIVTFWTSYGINPEYIHKQIVSGIEQSRNPLRIAHSRDKKDAPASTTTKKAPQKQSEGCYIATAVYGSYDCAQVMILRRYRDDILSATVSGRTFIKLYYRVSPWLVAHFSGYKWFNNFFRKRLDKLLAELRLRGISSGGC